MLIIFSCDAIEIVFNPKENISSSHCETEHKVLEGKLKKILVYLQKSHSKNS